MYKHIFNLSIFVSILLVFDCICQVFTLFANFTFTLEQIIMFLGNQSNQLVDTLVENACRFYSNPNTLFKLTVTLES
jgi:hypothetical protein